MLSSFWLVLQAPLRLYVVALASCIGIVQWDMMGAVKLSLRQICQHAMLDFPYNLLTWRAASLLMDWI